MGLEIKTPSGVVFTSECRLFDPPVENLRGCHSLLQDGCVFVEASLFTDKEPVLEFCSCGLGFDLRLADVESLTKALKEFVSEVLDLDQN